MSGILDYTWAEKEALWLLAVLPLLTVWYSYTLRTKSQTLRFSAVDLIGTGSSGIWRHLLFAARMLALASLILAFARPQLPEEEVVRTQYSEGIDIVITFDISGSMLAEDFKPNRLEVAREVAVNFIKGRPADRIGLVVYEGEAFTQCPLTTDHAVLIRLFSQVKSGMIKDGTAIGMGLATAVNRLRESDGKSKVVILLTDGVNNRGNIDPVTAAEVAAEYNVRVYTIGIGKKGTAPFPARDPFGRKVYTQMEVDIDEEGMQKIAEMTDGKYFRATDKSTLEAIYQEIDQLEKAKVKVIEFKADPPEKFHAFVYIGLALLLLEFMLRYTLLKSIP